MPAKQKKDPTTIITGRVDYVNPHYAYIILPAGQQDIRVKKKNLCNALHKDLVKVTITRYDKNQRPIGKVIEILERATHQFVGRLLQHAQSTLLISDDPHMHYPIILPRGTLKKVNNNHKVMAQITAWPIYHQNPTGKVVKILGKPGEHATEMQAIMAEFNLPTDFPKSVLEEVKTISTKITPTEIKKRKDFRNIPTFTIDPEDAKDHDDALSCTPLPNGNYEVGIHIADVSHYVKENTSLDQEAYQRGTSVYLVDRTLPMLPEALANDLCSLKPHADKLCLSIVFEIDLKAQIQATWIGETIICPHRKFTYQEAQAIIDLQKGDLCKTLTLLNQLAQQLRSRREQKGAINFETTEVKIQLDAHHNPINIIPKERKDTHKLIEEFMLLANQQVAERIHHIKAAKTVLPFVYRIHDDPDAEKLSNFSLFVKKLGHTLPPKKSTLAKNFNALSTKIQGTAQENIIQSMAIRTMAKATYTTQSKPHFALAFSHYTHFTSPIRRYPDLMVHRLLKRYLKKDFKTDQSFYEQKCKHASEREHIAVAAERASIKYKQVVFMEKLKGKVLQGVISGLTEWGIYITLQPTQCEGLIRLADMHDDYYVLDEKKFSIMGQRGKKIYHLGDPVNVKVKACHLDRRAIDLVLAP